MHLELRSKKSESELTLSRLMHVVHAGETLPQEFGQSLFLVGPTPRASHVPSWRPEALQLLQRAAYRGVVFVPESPGDTRPDYDSQVAWETAALKRSDIVLVWAATSKEDMPALSTRTEFGEHLASGRMVFGSPAEAWKTNYLKKKAAEYGIPAQPTLLDTILAALLELEPGSLRKEAETAIPLKVWRTARFQNWYRNFKAQGNSLAAVRKVHHPCGPVPFTVLEISARRPGKDRLSDMAVFLKE